MRQDRVWLGMADHEASLRIKDRSGRDRIVIGVDGDGQPTIRVFDENGEEVARLPS